MRIRSVALILLAGVPLNALAETTCYKITKMAYNNDGGYKSCFHIMWKSAANAKKYKLGNSDLDQNCPGSSSDKQFSGDLSAPGLTSANNRPAEGDEVWGQYHITAGQSKSCRGNENSVFYYYKDGGKVTYRSAGTTLNNNRCRVQQPDSKYEIDCP